MSPETGLGGPGARAEPDLVRLHLTDSALVIDPGGGELREDLVRPALPVDGGEIVCDPGIGGPAGAGLMSARLLDGRAPEWVGLIYGPEVARTAEQMLDRTAGPESDGAVGLTRTVRSTWFTRPSRTAWIFLRLAQGLWIRRYWPSPADGSALAIDPFLLESMDIVDQVRRVTEPFKKANRKFHPQDSVIECGHGVRVGAGSFQVIAGPCSVEGENLLSIARAVKEAGATMLRGGAYKPRTSPYAYQGMGERGLDLLLEASCELDMPIVTEVMDPRDVQLFVDRQIDVMQIGARNAQNFSLLKEVGRTTVPVLLKRGMSQTLDELLMAAEYVMSEGNKNVILCERGIRTYETYTRNTFDISAIAAIKHLSHLPIIADPSHGTGKWRMIKPMSLASIAAGADGLIIEVHPNPARALSDGPQSLTPENYRDLMASVQKLSRFMADEAIEPMVME